MALDPLAPLKLGVRATIGLLRLELHLVERLLGLDREPDAPVPQAEPFGPEPPVSQPEPASSQAPPARPEPAPEPPVALEPEPPVHIDTEAELVGEFAEAGAEDGAGAELRVAEPWDGYKKMPVAALRDRVAVANAEELAVIQLYEMTHRRRRTVLDAVERRSRQLANAPARS